MTYIGPRARPAMYAVPEPPQPGHSRIPKVHSVHYTLHNLHIFVHARLQQERDVNSIAILHSRAKPIISTARLALPRSDRGRSRADIRRVVTRYCIKEGESPALDDDFETPTCAEGHDLLISLGFDLFCAPPDRLGLRFDPRRKPGPERLLAFLGSAPPSASSPIAASECMKIGIAGIIEGTHSGDPSNMAKSAPLPSKRSGMNTAKPALASRSAPHSVCGKKPCMS